MKRPGIRGVLIGAAITAAALCTALAARPQHRAVWTDGDTIRSSIENQPPRQVLWRPAEPLRAASSAQLDEYEPRRSADGTVIVFVRNRPGRNADLYQIRWSPSGWSEPAPIDTVNTAADELGPELSRDGQWLYFYSDRPGGLGGYDLWVAHADREGWGTPVNLGPRINSRWNEYGPALDPTGQRLYFSSNRPRPGEPPAPDDDAWTATIRERRTRHDYDLYTADLSQGATADAAALPSLNTAADEGAPAVSPGGDFLYFASDRPGGLGGFDVYRTRLFKDGGFGTVENLGPGVNSPANDLDPTLSSDGFRLTFSSNRPAPLASAASANENRTGTPADPLRYSLWTSVSREVYSDADVAPSALAAWWSAVWPWIAFLLLSLVPLALLAWLLRDARWRRRFVRLSLLTQCLLIALLLHAALASLFSVWKVGAALMDLMPGGRGTRVVLTSSAPAVGSVAAQIQGPVVDGPALPSLQPPAESAPLPLALALLDSPADTVPLPSPQPPLSSAPFSLSVETPPERPTSTTPLPLPSPAATASVATPAPSPATPLAAEATLPPTDPTLPRATPPTPPQLADTPAQIAVPPRRPAPTAGSLTVEPGQPASDRTPQLAAAVPAPEPPPTISAPIPAPAAHPIASEPVPTAPLSCLPPPPMPSAVTGESTLRADKSAPPLPNRTAIPAPTGVTLAMLPAPDFAGHPDGPPRAVPAALSQLAAASPRATAESTPVPSPPPRTARTSAAEPTLRTLKSADTTLNPAPLSLPQANAATPAGASPIPAPLPGIARASTSALPVESPDTPHPALSTRASATSPAPAAPPPPPPLAAIDTQVAIPTPRETFEQRNPESRAKLVESMGGSSQTERAVGLALDWFLRHQSPDGHWSAEHFDDRCGHCDGPAEFTADAAMTGMVLLCYLGAGHTHTADGPFRQTVNKGLQWLLARQAPDGDLRRGETMYGQTVAAVALCEAFAMTRDPSLAEPARRAVNLVLVRAASGQPTSDRDTSVLGWLVFTVESARRAGFDVPQATFESAQHWLASVASPRSPGVYAYTPGGAPSAAMTAEAMFVHQLLGHTRTEPLMERSAHFVLRSLPTWQADAPTYYWYYATLALFQHQGDAWKQWNDRLVPQLLAHQAQDGPTAGSWAPTDRWSRMGGRVYQTAVCTLSLEVYYRYRTPQ